METKKNSNNNYKLYKKKNNKELSITWRKRGYIKILNRKKNPATLLSTPHILLTYNYFTLKFKTLFPKLVNLPSPYNI